MTGTARRTLGGLAALGLTLGLSACSSQGVWHHGGTAATLGDTQVGTAQVQTALDDLQALAPDAQITGSRVAAVLALTPSVNSIAEQHGASVTQAQARQAFQQGETSRTPSQGALKVLATESELSKLVQGTSAQQSAITKLLNTADVQMNPRYGVWRKGGSYGPAATDWIVKSPTSTQSNDPAPRNGRPAPSQ